MSRLQSNEAADSDKQTGNVKTKTGRYYMQNEVESQTVLVGHLADIKQEKIDKMRCYMKAKCGRG